MRMILASEDFPAISRDALDALKTTPDDEASIQRLAAIVLREYSLTLKVLRTANSAYYRRSNRNVESASHAMLLLGARTVRHLAASQLIFDHYRKHSPGLKELMLLSLLTANHARELSILCHLPDPEEMHLCGMFRNLGEVLVAGYFPTEYARILQHMELKGRGASVAAFEVIDFCYEDLGEAMARHWGMPESVVSAMKADGPFATSKEGVVASFAHDLTTAVYRGEHDPRRDTVADVMARYARRLELTRDQVGAVMRTALRETRATFASARVSLDDLRLRRLQQAAMAQLHAWRPQTMATGSEDDTPLMRDVAADVIPEGTGLRETLAAEVIQAARPESAEDVNRVVLMALDAIRRGGPFDRVVFCTVTPERDAVRARSGVGTGVEDLLQRFNYALSPREGPVAVAMLRRQSIYLPVERDFTAQELRFAQSLGSSSFGVFPVMVGARLVGCVYCDRPWNARLPDRATLAFVRALCDGVVKGIQARHAAAPPPSGERATPESARSGVV